MSIFASLLLLLLSAATHAAEPVNCETNSRGKKICGNGENAVAVNPKTGNTVAAEEGKNGVTSIQTNKGGQAKTKDGKGVYVGPGGTKCVKTENNQACR